MKEDILKETNITYRKEDYYFELPSERIAQYPVSRRDNSRLLHLVRKTAKINHLKFYQLPSLLKKGDILVLNKSRVIPARIIAKRHTGGKVEILFLDVFSKENPFLVLIKGSHRIKEGEELLLPGKVKGKLYQKMEWGKALIELTPPITIINFLEKYGKTPLPPYIKRDNDRLRPGDKLRYQTLYAEEPGSVAAPTAGLHFSNSLLKRLSKKGVNIVKITLHVGPGTFEPVREKDIRKHKLSPELYNLSEEAARILETGIREKRKIIAVGTTSVRLLEYMAQKGGFYPGTGLCDLYIYPGFKFKVIKGLITNFHLPGSSLILLVSAFAGRSLILNTYKKAIQAGYRFYSFGDAMFIE